jgi:hypothetical protein
MELFLSKSSSSAPIILKIEYPEQETVSSLRVKVSQLLLIPTHNFEMMYKGNYLRDDCPDPLNALFQEEAPQIQISNIIEGNTEGNQAPPVKSFAGNNMFDMFTKFIQDQGKFSEKPSGEFMAEMMKNNPKVQAMIEKNPQIKSALQDPALLQEAIELAANPKAFQTMMQNQERAMSQLENLPQGFQHLSQFYKDVGSVDEIFEMGAGRGRSSVKSSQPKQGINRSPFPNPWATPSSSSRPNQSQNPYTIDNNVLFDEKGFMRKFENVKFSKSGVPGESDFDWKDFRNQFKSQLEDLKEMGFMDEKLNVESLLAAEGDFVKALDIIDEETYRLKSDHDQSESEPEMNDKN